MNAVARKQVYIIHLHDIKPNGWSLHSTVCTYLHGAQALAGITCAVCDAGPAPGFPTSQRCRQEMSLEIAAASTDRFCEIIQVPPGRSHISVASARIS